MEESVDAAVGWGGGPPSYAQWGLLAAFPTQALGSGWK